MEFIVGPTPENQLRDLFKEASYKYKQARQEANKNQFTTTDDVEGTLAAVDIILDHVVALEYVKPKRPPINFAEHGIPTISKEKAAELIVQPTVHLALVDPEAPAVVLPEAA
jgi:hypothetical protein